MSAVDLFAEYRAALHATRHAELDALMRAGVSVGTIERIGPAVAPIRLSRNGQLFDPDPDSDTFAFILPVRGSNPVSPEACDPQAEVSSGPIVDLVAFSVLRPDRWALRRDAVTWLGCCEPQYLEPDPVRILRSPLSWLRHGCQGIVLLSRDQREQYRTLTCLRSIVAEDEAHANELRRVISHPWPGPLVTVGHKVACHA
jgi:hypothetical protein